MMKAILGATALGLVIAVGATGAQAQDINIYMLGEDGAGFEPGGAGGHHARGDRPMEGGHHRAGHGSHHGKVRGEGKHRERKMDRDRKMDRARRIDQVLDLIELYDQDQDGRVTQAEIDQGRAARLADFDVDGDGALSLQEYEALWLDAMRERMVDRFQSHDDDGNGQVTVAEFSKRTGRLVARRDRNQDGAIDLDDARGPHPDHRERHHRGHHGGQGEHGDNPEPQ